jgi:uncharacterized protein
MQTLRCLALWLALCASAVAAQIPVKPDKYFNDYAGMVSRDTADRLNRALEDFERQTSSQIVVAIYPKLPERAALEDFAVRAFEAWQVGQRGKDNGVVLFIFRDDRRMRIEVGYGLEGAIPDAIANRIIAEQMRPRFQAGDFEGGIVAGMNALMQAARGEYRGTGTTVYSRRNRQTPGIPAWVILLFFLLIVASGFRRRGTMYHRRRRNHWGGWGPWGGAGMFGSGRGWSGGGGGWGGGGGFLGGGGRSGGGGASGSW